MQGGLGLIDIRKKDLALKTNWVARVSQNSSIKQLAYEALRNPINDLIREANLNRNDIQWLAGERIFWVDVLYAWNELKSVS